MFEIKKSDLAGRIGVLYTNHGKVETPAYVPVVHPVRQSIPPKKMKAIGFDLVITNAFITLKQFGEDAVRRGIHGIIDYDGAVMTDSGGYQVLEYGNIDVDGYGAGPVLSIPLAVSLDGDSFDSGSYMVYAKHNRYIMDDGTIHLS